METKKENLYMWAQEVQRLITLTNTSGRNYTAHENWRKNRVRSHANRSNMKRKNRREEKGEKERNNGL